MQTMHFSKLLISAAIALMCTACSNKPVQQTPVEYRVDFEGTINVKGTGGERDTTLYRPRLGSITGQEGIAAQIVTTNVEQPIRLVTVGDTTTAKSTYSTYGYTLFVTPEIRPQQHFWNKTKIMASIKLDHSVKQVDGSASHKMPSAKVDLALGEETKLNWSNEGKDYELTLRLADISPVSAEQVSKDSCVTPAVESR